MSIRKWNPNWIGQKENLLVNRSDRPKSINNFTTSLIQGQRQCHLPLFVVTFSSNVVSIFRLHLVSRWYSAAIIPHLPASIPKGKGKREGREGKDILPSLCLCWIVLKPSWTNHCDEHSVTSCLAWSTMHIPDLQCEPKQPSDHGLILRHVSFLAEKMGCSYLKGEKKY